MSENRDSTAASSGGVVDTDDMGDWEVVSPPKRRQRLDSMVSVRFSPDEVALVREAARAADLSTSEYVRRTVLAASRRPEPLMFAKTALNVFSSYGSRVVLTQHEEPRPADASQWTTAGVSHGLTSR